VRENVSIYTRQYTSLYKDMRVVPYNIHQVFCMSHSSQRHFTPSASLSLVLSLFFRSMLLYPISHSLSSLSLLALSLSFSLSLPYFLVTLLSTLLHPICPLLLSSRLPLPYYTRDSQVWLTRTYTHRHRRTHARSLACTHARTLARTHARTHAHTHTHTSTHMHARTHVYTQAHTRTHKTIPTHKPAHKKTGGDNRQGSSIDY
jgi:hypothetical protein